MRRNSCRSLNRRELDNRFRSVLGKPLDRWPGEPGASRVCGMARPVMRAGKGIAPRGLVVDPFLILTVRHARCRIRGTIIPRRLPWG